MSNPVMQLVTRRNWSGEKEAHLPDAGTEARHGGFPSGLALSLAWEHRWPWKTPPSAHIVFADGGTPS